MFKLLQFYRMYRADFNPLGTDPVYTKELKSVTTVYADVLTAVAISKHSTHCKVRHIFIQV